MNVRGLKWPRVEPGSKTKAVATTAVATKAVATKAVATKAVATKAVAIKAVAIKAVATTIEAADQQELRLQLFVVIFEVSRLLYKLTVALFELCVPPLEIFVFLLEPLDSSSDCPSWIDDVDGP